MRYKAGLETRDRIIEATRSLIATDGLDGTTIKAICEQAGVLPGSFYNLFDSKEQAIMAVVREAIDAIDPDPSHEGNDSLADLVDAFARFIVDQGELARVYIRLALTGGHGSTEIRDRTIRHHRGRVERFTAAIVRQSPGIEPAEASRRAETLVSALNGLALSRVIDENFDVILHARALLNQVAEPV